ncbi:MAG TPA: penicillin-binding protein 2, partial [Ardenticatenaceae bacterium]|nr:penicillin-binding protein 2 [Ardenticatenaceae bacterium]
MANRSANRQKIEAMRLRAELSEQRRRRINAVGAVMFAVFFILGFRLYYWQVHEAETVKSRVRTPVEEAVDAHPRGTIRDRNGYLLAADGVEYDLAASPNIIGKPAALAADVSVITGDSPGRLEQIFSGEEPYVLIAESLPYTMGQQLIALDSGALQVTKHLKRHYPNGGLAAHILGFVNAERQGHYGVEAFYDDVLRRAGQPAETTTPLAEEVKLGNRPFAPSRDGIDLVLTIDRAIQFIVEQELQQALSTTGAASGSIIVLDPKSGDILAMTSLPSYDPNDYASYASSDAKLFTNPVLEQQYEPGSVFKIITVAAALDSGIVSPSTVYTDTGVLEVGGQYIRNWNGGAYGPQTPTGILGYSLNTGTAWLATLLGSDRQLRYYDEFGFGKKTGIDLGGEVTGQIKRPGDGVWHPSDVGTNAFGQGIGVTPIQLVSAVAAVVNHGRLMQPRVVKAIIDHGQLQEIAPVERGQPIRAEIADSLRMILADAVEIETQSALLGDWRIGGKTGTAQVPIPGGYHATDTIASFVGFAPADDPQFVILVKLDRPPGELRWGSTSAAPAFQRLARRLLDYWAIPPDRFRVAQQPAQAVEGSAPEAPTP